MTFKELIILAEQRSPYYTKEINDKYLKDILRGFTLHEIDKLNSIQLRYDGTGRFNIKQLDRELQSGFYVYYYVTCLDYIILDYFNDKIKAFSNFRKLSQDTLVMDRLLIDTSKGIIAGGNQAGNIFNRNQYGLYRDWISKKYPIGSKVKVIQICNTSYFAYLDRNSLIGKIGTIMGQDMANILAIDFGNSEIGYIEVGKDQIKIV